MSFPIVLPSGYIAVYGTGSTSNPSGITQPEPNSDLRFGSVYHIWDGGAAYIYGGDQIMFKESDVFTRIISEEIPYTIIPARLVTKQDIPL